MDLTAWQPVYSRSHHIIYCSNIVIYIIVTDSCIDSSGVEAGLLSERYAKILLMT